MSTADPAPKGLRLHVGLLGRRNVGKSSLLNALTQQDVSLVSPLPGTTTDPVEKPMELSPLGPVLFIDTAGLDDHGDLGSQRVERSHRVLDRLDLAVLVAESGRWGDFEEALLADLRARSAPVVVVLNKSDLQCADQTLVRRLAAKGTPCVVSVATIGRGLSELRAALAAAAPPGWLDTPALVSDLVPAGETAVLVVPIDPEAPKGRLILPQVQAIRDLLDADACCLVVKERELAHALAALRRPPRLVVTDSQAFLEVAADTPPDVPLTSFSILMAHAKGDLTTLVQGTLAIDDLRPGHSVLLAEACTHHPVAEDIGRVKIPRWLTQYVGGRLETAHVQGQDFPDDLTKFQLVVHCGACMWNRRAMLSRQARCAAQGVPITNYGLTIAHSLGLLDRALSPFPGALEAYRRRGGRAPAAGLPRGEESR